MFDEVHPELLQMIETLTPEGYVVSSVGKMRDFGIRDVTFKHVLGDHKFFIPIRLGCNILKLQDSMQETIEKGNRDAIKNKDWYEFRNQFDIPEDASLRFDERVLSLRKLYSRHPLLECEDWRGLDEAQIQIIHNRLKRIKQEELDCVEQERQRVAKQHLESLALDDKDFGLDESKEYLLFAGHRYYPQRGVEDLHLRGNFKECKVFFREEEREIAKSYVDNWGQIVDPVTLEIVLYGLNREGRITWSKKDLDDD
jgi:hypothetical protein